MNSSKKGKEKLVAVFDVGSGSVGGALVRFSANKPEILLTVRVPIILSPDLDFNLFLSETSRSLEAVAARLDQAALGAPHDVHCFLSSPWYAAQTRIIKLNKNTPFTLTPQMMTDLSCKEIKNFEQGNLERYKELGEEIRILDGEVMQVKLNGYKIMNPFDRKAKELEAAMFVSLSPEKAIAELEYRIQKFFNRDIKFHSFPLASFVVARDLFPAAGDFLLIDAAGEITDLPKVVDDVLEESISFPLGKNYFIRNLSRGLGYDMDEASSLFGLYLAGHASKRISAEIDRVLEGPRQDWLKALRSSLHEIKGSKAVPKQIFLMADADVAPWLKALIEQEELHQYTATPGRFNVTILESGIFRPYCQVNRRAEFDPFLILESIFINRL